MSTSLGELAHLVEGQLHGRREILINDAATLKDATAGQITFISDSKYGCELSTCGASAVLAPPDFAPDGIAFITVRDVSDAFARIVAHFRPPRQFRTKGVHATAHVANSARLGPDVSVYPGAFIGEDVEISRGAVVHSGVRIMDGCKIGDDAVLFPNAVLYENTQIGARCIVHSNAVIGAYGFGYDMVDGRHRLSPQLGHVEIGDDVEIGATTTIDRGTYGATTVGDGTKIDNQVMIGHNCRIGRHNILCSQVGIAGSSRTGEYVVMAGQVGVKDHVVIGDGAQLGAKTGVKDNVPPGVRMFGIPGTPEREQMVQQAATRKLPEMRKTLKALKRQVDRLEQQANADCS